MSNRPNVLVCTQGFPRFPDDHHASFVLDHARALVAAGAAVTVSCPSAPGLPVTDSYPAEGTEGSDARADIAVRRFRYAPRGLETLAYSGGMHHHAKGPQGLLLPLFFAGFLLDVVRGARRADVIHAHWWLPSGIVAVIAGRLTNTPVVVQLHGTDVAMSKGPIRGLAKLVLRAADGVVAVSSALADWAWELAGVRADVLPMPLRPALAGGLDQAPEPPPVDGPVFAVGRLVAEKGFDVLVRAAAKAGVPLVIAGDGHERPRLEVLAREVGADVSFLGPVAPGALGPHYRAARVVAVPSRREGFGLVAAEALANGRPVVASDVGGLRSAVTDGVTGVLVPPDDPEAMAAGLARVEASMGAAGPDSVRWIAADRIGAATLEVYQRVIAARPSSD